MRRLIVAVRKALRTLFLQRCFLLFALLLALIATAPLNSSRPTGVLVTNVVDTLIMLTTVAVVGRTMLSFVVILCLAIPTVVLRWLSIDAEGSSYYGISLQLHAVIYAIATTLLLRYVFNRYVVVTDRLWGVAAAYLMVGVFWSFVYAIVDRAVPSAFSVRGTIAPLELTDLIYFSFATLTTTGFGDVVPLTHSARTVSIVETISGQLFMAILITRLLEIYPQRRRKRLRGKRLPAESSKA